MYAITEKERSDEIPLSWVGKDDYLWCCFRLCTPLIKTYWLPKAIYETNCFGMAVAVGGQTLHIGRSTEMGFGVFETTFGLQTMVMRPSRMISPSPNI